MLVAMLGLTLFYFAVDLPRTALVGDTVFQGALDRSARAAAQQYDEQSLAAGTPQIDQSRAVVAVRQHLAGELKLDAATFQPQAGSPIVNVPDVNVLVYNGPVFPYVVNVEPGVQVTLEYPGVVVTLDASIRISSPISSDKSVAVQRYAAAMWMPRQKP
jgi:hypothetical protein